MNLRQASLPPSPAFTLTQTMSEQFSHVSLLFLDSGASPLPQSHSRGVRVEEAGSDSEDFSPTPSLAEVSSDDLSWLDDKDSGEKECSLNEKCTQAHFP